MEGLANWATRRSLLLRRRFALAGEQPKAMKSRMTRECHVRFCEGLGVKFPGATRPDINAGNGSPVVCKILAAYDSWMLPRMTAGLLLGAGLPLFDQLFPPMPLIEQVQNTPLLITAVLMFCLAAAFLALWRAAPDFRAFRTLGIFFAMVAVSQSSDYFGGQTLYWCVRAIASGMLVEAAGEAMQIPRRRWTLLFWPIYLFVSVAVWFPNLSFTADWPMLVSGCCSRF